MAKEQWPYWTDAMGNTYSPGDLIAYASVSGRSPQLVFGEVIRINKFNSKGEEIVKRSYTGKLDSSGRSIYKESPSCTVTVRPVLDARGFYRTTSKTEWERNPDGSIKQGGNHKTVKTGARLVTLQILENIVAVRVTEADVEGTVEKLKELHDSLEGGNE